MIIVYTDGLCQPTNPDGVGTWAYTIDFEDILDCRYTRYGVLGQGKGITNQSAEYKAVVEALRKLQNLGLVNEDIILYSDSAAVISQLLGHWKANKGEYLPYFFEAKKLLEYFTNLKLQWIPRRENQEADKLTRVAYEKYCLKKGIKVKYSRGRGFKP